MKFTVLTLFPNVITEYINTSIIKKAIDSELVTIDIIDLRDFGIGTRRNVDDTVYGGGDGMIITLPVLDKAINFVKESSTEEVKIVFLSPRGEVLNQDMAKREAEDDNKHILLIAGHYEGIDERIYDLHNITEISIGDYVLTGGELPALVYMDSIIRLIPGVIKEGSKENESHNDLLLEEPQYTKPQEYKGLKVPEVLLSGNHEKTKEFRYEQKILTTYSKRKDLLEKYITKNKDKEEIINNIIDKKEGN